MIARVWHGKTKKEHAELYRDYVVRTGVQEYRNSRGNLGIQIWQQDDGDVTHIWTVTLWKDLASIKSFAGDDHERARYYPEDERYLLELEPTVCHYNAFSFPTEGNDWHWRIRI